MNKNKIIWFIVFLGLVALTMYTITNSSSTFSFEGFVRYLSVANPYWIVAAVGCMLLYILIEGFSIKYLTDFLGSRITVRRGFLYSAADIFFSAITPSATGGQPASAFFMMRDSIHASVTAMSLLINIALYTVSIIFIGAVCIIFSPSTFLRFGAFSRFLIICGFVIQITCVTMFLLLVYKDKIMYTIADKILVVAKKLHLAKHVEKKRKKLEKSALEYKECSRAIKDHFGVIVKVFLLNVLQRLAQIGVTACVYIAACNRIDNIGEVIAAQGCVILGSNAVPVPGAVGVADYLFFEGFDGIVNENLVNLELLSRGISFYVCIILCIAVVAVCYFTDRKTRK